MPKRNEKYLGGYAEYPLFFKGFLVFGIIVIAFIFIYYTQNVIGKIKQDSKRVLTAYARLWQMAASESPGGPEIDVIFEEIIQKSDFPIVVTDANGEPQAWREVKVAWDDTTYASKQKLKKIVEGMDKHKEPIPIYFGEEKKIINYLHYGDSKLITKLKLMPLVEVGVLFLFILVGFITFRNIKRSEQRSIWVGMAKETAHQLGTPLSSLLGWLELLRTKCESFGTSLQDKSVSAEGARLPSVGQGSATGRHNKSAPFVSKSLGARPNESETDNLEENKFELDEMIKGMQADIKRLEKIATRFGQIGSTPELKSTDLNKIVSETVAYFKRRLPHAGSGVVIKENLESLLPIKVNAELLSWVIENLLKNSLEAVDSKQGVIEISTKLDQDKKNIIIEVCDNGRGIPSREQKKIFKPGYTTKKRGWGLGLSLAKRIVEEYHLGKILLKESIPNQKTTFLMVIPIQ
ncbi:MAG: HAMP domain-containing histidine kinase [candidate division Zixibacteria bacterium]|nr:HAMP domain-containing histidine kinase [candidate division Zixibacteria bacterium]